MKNLIILIFAFLISCESETVYVYVYPENVISDDDVVAVVDQQQEVEQDLQTIDQSIEQDDNEKTEIIPDDVQVGCGNGVVSPENEVCDIYSFKDCKELGDYVSGKAKCNSDCKGWNTETCIAAKVCGNGIVEDGEVCDKNKADCVKLPNAMYYTGGMAMCLDDCSGYEEGTCDPGKIKCQTGICPALFGTNGFGQYYCDIKYDKDPDKALLLGDNFCRPAKACKTSDECGPEKGDMHCEKNMCVKRYCKYGEEGQCPNGVPVKEKISCVKVGYNSKGEEQAMCLWSKA